MELGLRMMFLETLSPFFSLLFKVHSDMHILLRFITLKALLFFLLAGLKTTKISVFVHSETSP